MASMYLSTSVSMILAGFLSDFIINRKILTKYVSRRVFESIGKQTFQLIFVSNFYNF